MKKKIIALFIVVLAMLVAGNVLAWRSIRVGNKGFERAWMAYTNKQPDKAAEHFAKAADAFAEALAEDPPSRTARFTSNLLQAGMSFYFSGRYDAALDSLNLAFKQDDRAWEAPVLIGLSHGRLGDQKSAVEAFEQYLAVQPGQRILSNEVMRMDTALDAGEVTLADAVAQVEAALRNQFVDNIVFNTTARKSAPVNERCSGAFWWRMNSAPCSANNYNWND